MINKGDLQNVQSSVTPGPEMRTTALYHEKVRLHCDKCISQGQKGGVTFLTNQPNNALHHDLYLEEISLYTKALSHAQMLINSFPTQPKMCAN